MKISLGKTKVSKINDADNIKVRTMKGKMKRVEVYIFVLVAKAKTTILMAEKGNLITRTCFAVLWMWQIRKMLAKFYR